MRFWSPKETSSHLGLHHLGHLLEDLFLDVRVERQQVGDVSKGVTGGLKTRSQKKEGVVHHLLLFRVQKRKRFRKKTTTHDAEWYKIK